MFFESLEGEISTFKFKVQNQTMVVIKWDRIHGSTCTTHVSSMTKSPRQLITSLSAALSLDKSGGTSAWHLGDTTTHADRLHPGLVASLALTMIRELQKRRRLSISISSLGTIERKKCEVLPWSKHLNPKTACSHQTPSWAGAKNLGCLLQRVIG